MDTKLWVAIAIMVSAVAGASVLGFPFVFAKIGFFTGLITLILIGFATTLMSLYVAELALREDKIHMISGFARHYFGKRGEYFTLIVETFGLYTAIIAYLIAIGAALSNIFGLSSLVMGTAFFVVAAFFILFGFKRFNKLDMAVAAIKILLLIFFIAALFPTVQSANLSGLDIAKIFSPFGIVLFACLGYNVIPEMKKILEKTPEKLMPAIVIAMLIIFAIYALFSYVFIGSFGSQVGEVAVVGLPKFTLIGNIAVLVAMAIPFIAIADAIKHVYVKDMGLDKRISWFLSAFIPFLIYVYLNLGFVTFLQISGAYAGGLLGILTCLIVIKARKIKTDSKFVVPGGNLPAYFAIAIFSIGIVYQTLALIGLI